MSGHIFGGIPKFKGGENRDLFWDMKKGKSWSHFIIPDTQRVMYLPKSYSPNYLI